MSFLAMGSSSYGEKLEVVCPRWDLNPSYWLERPVSLTGLDDRGNLFFLWERKKTLAKRKKLRLKKNPQNCLKRLSFTRKHY